MPRIRRLLLGALFFTLPAHAEPFTQGDSEQLRSTTLECDREVLRLSDIAYDRMPQDSAIYTLGGWTSDCDEARADLVDSFRHQDLADAKNLLDQMCSAVKGYALKPGMTCSVGYQNCVVGHWETSLDAMKQWRERQAQVKSDRAAMLEKADGCATPTPTPEELASAGCGSLGIPCDYGDVCARGVCRPAGETLQDKAADRMTEKIRDETLKRLSKSASSAAIRKLAGGVLKVLESDAFGALTKFLESENEEATTAYAKHLGEVSDDVKTLAWTVARAQSATDEQTSRAEADDLAGVSHSPHMTRARLDQSVSAAQAKLAEDWAASEGLFQGMETEHDLYTSGAPMLRSQRQSLKPLVEGILPPE